MNANERRKDILKKLIIENRAITGSELANIYEVTRQVIVKDIAILRAEGTGIIATPGGYMVYNSINDRVKEIIAVNHGIDSVIDELDIIIKLGGIIEDVIVEHPIYGEIKGTLMIKNQMDLENFKDVFMNNESQPLLILTKGIHLHTVSTDTKENMELIKKELKEKGFIL